MNRRIFILCCCLALAGCQQSEPNKGTKYPFTHSHGKMGEHTHIKIVNDSPDQKQRYFSADSGSGSFLGYDDEHRAIYGSTDD